MIPKSIIELAIKGGWRSDVSKYPPDESKYAFAELYPERVALDPTFWQALGKALGWEVENAEPLTPLTSSYAHRFYDLILTNGDTDKFWADLLSNK